VAPRVTTYDVTLWLWVRPWIYGVGIRAPVRSDALRPHGNQNEARAGVTLRSRAAAAFFEGGARQEGLADPKRGLKAMRVPAGVSETRALMRCGTGGRQTPTWLAAGRNAAPSDTLLVA
jgi:hypothetical protein